MRTRASLGAAVRRSVRFVAVLAVSALVVLFAVDAGTRTRAGIRASAVACPARPTAPGFIAKENLRATKTAWTYSATRNTGLEAFANRTSVSCGLTVRLMVSTTAPSATVTAWRMGYYGGKGGRAVYTSAAFRTRHQSAAVVDPVTRMRRAAWGATVTIPIDGRFIPGSYLWKLTDSLGGQAFVPLVVTDPASTTPLLFMSEPLTWTAYNAWGGASAYRGPSGTDADRSLVASLDRPFGKEHGMATYLTDEYPLIRLIEQRGLDVTYATDIDVHSHPDWLLHHRGVILGGHCEYWSARLRGGFDTARDQGVNIALFGADSGYWQVRLQTSNVGSNRAFAIYRYPAQDPITATDPQASTVRFRDLPARWPESRLFGQQYQGCPGVYGDMVLNAPAWPFPDGLPAGTVLPKGVRQEFDRAGLDDPPANARLQIMATSPLACAGITTFQNVTYYTAGSGAGVFSAGTIGWVCHLWGSTCAYGGVTSSTTRSVLASSTVRMITAMAAAPLGTTHPSTPTGLSAAQRRAAVPPDTVGDDPNAAVADD
jgi:hypothetical protein